MKIEAVLSHLFAINAVFIEHCAITGVMAIIDVRIFVPAFFFDTHVAFATFI
jgi:hypothetical protein